MATVMSMVADNASVLGTFEALDCCTKAVMAERVDDCTLAIKDAKIECRYVALALTYD
jgi:hypothetical protein